MENRKSDNRFSEKMNVEIGSVCGQSDTRYAIDFTLLANQHSSHYYHCLFTRVYVSHFVVRMHVTYYMSITTISAVTVIRTAQYKHFFFFYDSLMRCEFTVGLPYCTLYCTILCKMVA